MKCNVKMGRAFYEKAAAELNQWGQDPDSARLATLMSAGELVKPGKTSQPSGEKGRGVAAAESCAKATCEEEPSEVDNGGSMDMEVDSLSGDSLEGDTVAPAAPSELLTLPPLHSWMQSGRLVKSQGFCFVFCCCCFIFIIFFCVCVS